MKGFIFKLKTMQNEWDKPRKEMRQIEINEDSIGFL